MEELRRPRNEEPARSAWTRSDAQGAGAGVPDLGVVVPAYNESENLRTLTRALVDVLERASVDFEILFVDDGSTDDTARVIRALADEEPRVRGLLLTRNFGHQAAVSTGLRHARGRAIGVMDADMQDRPEDLLVLYEAVRGGADVAYAIRRTRQESWLLRLAYRSFYRLQNALSPTPMQMDAGDFSVMDAAFVARLNELPERSRYVRGLRSWLGGTQVGVPVDRDARHQGDSKYSFSKLLRLAVDGIVSFSFVPLRLAVYLGLACSLLAFVGVIVVLVWRFTGLLPSGAGLATIALSVLFLGGIQLLTIGIVGEYLARVFEEVKGRPTAVVAETISSRSTIDRPERR